MPKARARRATSMPIFPRPIYASVFGAQFGSCNDFFSTFRVHGFVGAAEMAAMNNIRLEYVPPPQRVCAGFHDRDALARGGFHLDVVDTHAGAADHAQLLGVLEQGALLALRATIRASQSQVLSPACRRAGRSEDGPAGLASTSTALAAIFSATRIFIDFDFFLD